MADSKWNPLNWFRKPGIYVSIIGAYPGRDKTFGLIEILLKGSTGPFDINEFTQEWPTLPRNRWPVPYMAKFLNADGNAVIGDVIIDGPNKPSLWEGTIRLCFFFHFPAYDLPLWTPWGQVKLPDPTPRPQRLRMVRYKLPENPEAEKNVRFGLTTFHSPE